MGNCNNWIAEQASGGLGKLARGRPTDYRKEHVEQARKLCALGATDLELADFFTVDVATIYRWRNAHPDFCEAVIAGKGAADDRVERAFYNRCVGYTFDSEKLFSYEGAVVRAPIREHVPPDAGAALNWLKNRRADKWRDKIDHEHSGRIDVATAVSAGRLRVASQLSGD